MNCKVLYHPAKIGYFGGVGFHRHEWRNFKGELHREDGPAVERFFDDGSYSCEFFFEDKRHCLTGPAIIYKDGGKMWYVDHEFRRPTGDLGPNWIKGDGTQIWTISNSILHREDGPAVIYPDGAQHWYRFGVFHREGGPAITYADGVLEWWLNGIHISTEFGYQKPAEIHILENVCWLKEGF